MLGGFRIDRANAPCASLKVNPNEPLPEGKVAQIARESYRGTARPKALFRRLIPKRLFGEFVALGGKVAQKSRSEDRKSRRKRL